MDIILTGASRGIGFETALSMAKNSHCRIMAIARNQGALERLSNEIKAFQNGSQLFPIAFDLEQEDSILKIIQQIEFHHFKPDILINNAGLLINSSITELNPTDFDRMFQLNVKSVFFLVQSLIPYFQKGSHIINISSMGAYQGSAKFAGLSLYSASKGALAVLTESMAEELKPYQISVNCLALGAVQTEMLAEAFPGYSAPVSAAQMGKFIADFAFNGNRFFNGKILPVSLSTP
jgi:NAD(P)-dependent dehydrogenase (short-subunit alcohol dehydrogenase family)